MNKINIVTPPDMLFTDSLQLLVVYPSKQLQNELQNHFLSNTTIDVNVYVYDSPVQDKKEIDWLISVFKQCDTAIIDIDNLSHWARDLASFMIAKPKTYWLTNNQDSVYNSLSNNRVYNLEFLSKIGDNFETE